MAHLVRAKSFIPSLTVLVLRKKDLPVESSLKWLNSPLTFHTCQTLKRQK